MTDLQLLLSIESAFPPHEPPPHRTDSVGFEIGECLRFFCGPWESLSVKEVEEHYTCIAFFNDEEFSYYLPAYLRASVTTPSGGAAVRSAYELAYRGPLVGDLLTVAQLSVVVAGTRVDIAAPGSRWAR